MLLAFLLAENEYSYCFMGGGHLRLRHHNFKVKIKTSHFMPYTKVR